MNEEPIFTLCVLERTLSYYKIPLFRQFGLNTIEPARENPFNKDGPIHHKLYRNYYEKWANASRAKIPIKRTNYLDDIIKEGEKLKKRNRIEAEQEEKEKEAYLRRSCYIIFCFCFFLVNFFLYVVEFVLSFV